MVRTATLATLVLIQACMGSAWAVCTGANPAVTAATVNNVSTVGQENQYHLTATVTNIGSAAQAKNTLQFVDIFQYGQKLDAKGIPPLNPGQSYTFSYMWPRASDAGTGTTTLTFRLDERQPSSCTNSSPKSITF